MYELQIINHTYVKFPTWWVLTCIHTPCVSILPKSFSHAFVIPSSAFHKPPEFAVNYLFSFSIDKLTYSGCIYLIILFFFKYSCLHFLPPHPATPSLPPTLEPTPFGFGHVSFICVPWWSFPYFRPLSLSPLPFGYCHFVLYFNVSGYILLGCLFSWLSSTNRWDHMVFFFHCLARFT